MRKGDLFVNEQVMLRITVRRGQPDYWRLTVDERSKKQRLVRAKVLRIPAEGRKVELEYEGHIYDQTTRDWRLGNKTAMFDSRSILRTATEQEQLDREKAEANRKRVLQDAYKSMERDRPRAEKAELIEHTIGLLNNLGIAARAQGVEHLPSTGQRVATHIVLTDDAISELHQFLLAHLNTTLT